MVYYLYILYSANADRYYVGYSSDPWRRVIQHNENPSDTFTGKHSNWELMAVFSIGADKSEAIKIERFIKRQKSRKLIEKMLKFDFEGVGILAQLVRVPHMRD